MKKSLPAFMMADKKQDAKMMGKMKGKKKMPMKKMAKGGSMDGCAMKGKTKGKMM